MNTKKRLAMTLVGFASLAGTVSGAVLNVPGNYSNIQLAIIAANPGDTVLVADGTYTGMGNWDIDTQGKAITVKSLNGSGACIIDTGLSGNGFDIFSGEGPSTVIEGFTFVNLLGVSVKVNGSSPTVNDCVGEGAILTNSAAVFTNVDCGSSGIWIKGGAPTLTNCGSSGNKGLHSLNAGVTLVNCIFNNNNEPGITFQNGTLNATGCLVDGNVGGAVLTGPSANLVNCTLTNNFGPGITLQNGTLNAAGCQVDWNAGGAILTGSNATLFTCTFNDNGGRGITSNTGSLYASGSQANRNVGGVLLSGSSAVLDYCDISGNVDEADGARGGGIKMTGSGATVTGCTITSNAVGQDYLGFGGGVSIDNQSGATFTLCQINSNIAYGHFEVGGWGGGVYAEGIAAYTNCNIKSNKGNEAGGGIFAKPDAPQTLVACTIAQNQIAIVDGAGLVLPPGSSMVRCTIDGNLAGWENGSRGAGVLAEGTWFERCMFKNNKLRGDNAKGAGAYSHGGSTFVNCVFIANQATIGAAGVGGGLNVTSTDTVVDSTFYNNAAPTAPALFARAPGGFVGSDIFWGNGPVPVVGPGNLIYCDVEGGYAGPGNINVDPKFVNAAGNDLRLKSISPCIDAGSNFVIPNGVTTDHISSPRRLDDPNTVDTGAGFIPIVDMGAYEFIPPTNPCPWGPYNPNKAAPGDQFGSAVDVSGGTMVAGAYRSDGQGEASGAAQVLKADAKGGWAPAGDLIAPGTRAGDFFGASASIDGDTIAIGAPRNDTQGSNAGAVHIFRPSTGEWIYETTLLAPDGAPGNQFGYSVSVSGDTILVGAWKAPHDGVAAAGQAYVYQYRESNWEFVTTLSSADPHQGDAFGWSVDLHDGLALIGAPGADNDSGAVYGYFKPAGELRYMVTLVAPDGAPGDKFGYSVAASGDRAIIGAPWHNSVGMLAGGGAYLFNGYSGEWTHEATLTGSVVSQGANAGFSVALQGSRAAIGAPGAKGTTGAAAIFDLGVDQWEEAAVLTADDASAGDAFGGAIALDGAVLGVGAPFHDGPIGVDIGSAYIVSLNPCAPPQCYADFTQDDTLDLFDFLGYVNSFNAGEGDSDCTHDGSRDLFDFLCFVNAFNAGC